MFAGRAFQVLGADAEKVLSPNVRFNLNEGSCSNTPKYIERKNIQGERPNGKKKKSCSERRRKQT